MDRDESVIEILPSQVLLMIFRFLDVDGLLNAEQVCHRWKDTVNTCFATTRTLRLISNGEWDDLERMKRYGPRSVKYVKMDSCDDDDESIDWIAEIVNAFPNLLSLSLKEMVIRSSESFRVLPVKCSQITRIKINQCYILLMKRIVLKGFPGLKYLKLHDVEQRFGECFRELGSDVENLSLTWVEISPAGTSYILSRCTHLKALTIDQGFECDARSFSRFCKKSPLQNLSMDGLQLLKEVFFPISCLSLLENLTLSNCPAVDSDVLTRISAGCPNLQYVDLHFLPLVCDGGVGCFAQCRRLTHLWLHHCYFNTTVTDESLIEIAKACVLLETLSISRCELVTDRGLSAILAQCPRLRCLDVGQCSGVSDSTADAAIEAVESRDRHSSATHNLQSPHSECDVIIPRLEAIKTSRDCSLLWLHVSVRGLNRYKDGFSHPLLRLQLKYSLY